MIKKSAIILSFILAVGANAQDIHFSQFYNAPLKLNPGNAGAFRGDLRVISNYRNQWSSINSAFKTYGFSVDVPVSKSFGTTTLA